MNYRQKSHAQFSLSANALDCAKRKCRFFPNQCYVHGARARAKSSHIVVTNHALLFRDSATDGALLPPARYIVLDEAHGVEAEARHQLTCGVDSREITNALWQFRAKNAGMISQLRRSVHHAKERQGEVVARLDEFESQLAHVDHLVSDFISTISAFVALTPPTPYKTQQVWVSPELRSSVQWFGVIDVANRLFDAIAAGLKTGRIIVSLFEEASKETPQPVSEFVSSLFRWASFGAGITEAIAGDDDNRFTCAAIERRSSDNSVSRVALTVSNIEMGTLIADALLARANSVIFTSATLAVGKDFGPFCNRVGLSTFEADRYQTIMQKSQYDLDAQMKVYIASDLPDPRDSQYRSALEDALVNIHRITGGGVLTLFTNRREMEDLHTKVSRALIEDSLPVLAQGKGLSNKMIGERFLSEHTTSLFALKSYWEGFDAAGETLRCVVIPKLPFTPPSDPLSRARQYSQENTWSRYDLPDALLELKQAVGRLIRTSTDTGCVIIADSRAANARYAKKVQHSLPVEPLVGTIREICDHMRREAL